MDMLKCAHTYKSVKDGRYMSGDEMIGIAVLVKRFSVSVNKACLKKYFFRPFPESNRVKKSHLGYYC